jgi:hypothetical protein
MAAIPRALRAAVLLGSGSLLALLGQFSCERSFVIDLSGSFEDVNGKRSMLTRGA